MYQGFPAHVWRQILAETTWHRQGAGEDWRNHPSRRPLTGIDGAHGRAESSHAAKTSFRFFTCTCGHCL